MDMPVFILEVYDAVVSVCVSVCEMNNHSYMN